MAAPSDDPDAPEPTVYRYTVVGMLVTDRRIPNLETGATVCISDARIEGEFSDLLASLKQVDGPDGGFSDANDVLTRLTEL